MTDRQTDRHMTTAYTVLAWHRVVKKTATKYTLKHEYKTKQVVKVI